MSDATPQSMSATKAWLLAARPKTLAAAVVPVVVGTAVAIAEDSFALLPALAALVGAGLIQIGTNFANDYFDHQKGADGDDRLGPTRVTQAGIIEPEAVKRATGVTFLAAALVGVYLAWLGGWPIVAIGVASILSGLAYTGGPYPLGYHGLGDLFVFIFFGVVAVCGTHYVQALEWSTDALIASVPVGLLSTAILVVNNYRDIDTDRRADKRTLAVRIGRPATRIYFALLLLSSYAVPLVQWLALDEGLPIVLPLLTLPLAIRRLVDLSRHRGAKLNETLAGTAQLLAIFGLFYAAGVIL